MRLNLFLKLAMGICLLICKPALSCDKDKGRDKTLHIPSSFFAKLQKKLQRISDNKQSFTRLTSREDLPRINPLNASRVQLNNLTDKLLNSLYQYQFYEEHFTTGFSGGVL